jgi:hypothetical protein
VTLPPESYERLWSDRFEQFDVMLEELRRAEGDGHGG